MGVDPSTSNVYVADTFNSKYEVFDSSGTYQTQFGSTELGSAQTSGIAVNSAGTTAYGSDPSPSKVLVYSITPGAPPLYTNRSPFGNSGGVTLSAPGAECFDSQGNLWVADINNKRVVEFNASNVYQRALTLAASGTPMDVAVDSQGNVFVADTTNESVQEFNSAGQSLYNFKGSLTYVQGLALDGTGTFLYVTDWFDGVIGVFKVH